jgi:hypothetical protein
MPDPNAKDNTRGLPSNKQPSPNEVAGYYEPDPENSRALSDHWVKPVDRSLLDPELHHEVKPRTRDKTGV